MRAKGKKFVKPAWKERLDALRVTDLATIFGRPKPVIGMVHCWPLPGAPGYSGYGMKTIIEEAVRDATALAEGGCDGLIVENMWHVPFRAGAHVQPESIAAQMEVADGVIVGSSVKIEGEIANRVDRGRVQRFVQAARG